MKPLPHVAATSGCNHFHDGHEADVEQYEQPFEQVEDGLQRPAYQHGNELQQSENEDECGEKWVHSGYAFIYP